MKFSRITRQNVRTSIHLIYRVFLPCCYYVVYIRGEWMDYKDKVVVVIGGGKDIGRTVALKYGEASANVVVVDQNENLGRETVDSIYDGQGHGIFLQGDMTDEYDVTRVMERVIHFYGRIDILINNIGTNIHKPIFDITLDEWNQMINYNLNKVLLCTKEAVKYMKVMKNGSIVNILSGQLDLTSSEAEAYSVVKEATIAMTKSLATSLKQYEIQVNCLSPGVVKHKTYRRLKEMGYDEVMDMGLNDMNDIAKACLHLTEEDNEYLSGSNFVLDHDLIRKVVYFG